MMAMEIGMDQKTLCHINKHKCITSLTYFYIVLIQSYDEGPLREQNLLIYTDQQWSGPIINHGNETTSKVSRFL